MIKNYMFRPVPTIIRFSSEKVSVFTRSAYFDLFQPSSGFHPKEYQCLQDLYVSTCSGHHQIFIRKSISVYKIYMFRPVPAIIRFPSVRVSVFTRSCKHWYSLGWKPDDGRKRPKHVVFNRPLINIIRYTCCVIDLIPPPINFYTQRGWQISEIHYFNWSQLKIIVACFLGTGCFFIRYSNVRTN